MITEYERVSSEIDKLNPSNIRGKFIRNKFEEQQLYEMRNRQADLRISIYGKIQEMESKVDGFNKDLTYMKIAIDEAIKSKLKNGKDDPLVGSVIVKDGNIVATGYRGEIEPGDHSEFTALEKSSDEIISGATVYVTLEPCTVRNKPKIPCAERLKSRKIARIFIGMLDPNDKICGKGVRLLREAGIDVQLFPLELANQVEEQNRDFVRAMKDKYRMTHKNILVCLINLLKCKV